MKNNRKSIIIFVIVGAVILGAFIAISMINMARPDEYYLSTDIIKSIDYKDGKLTVKTRNDVVAVCVKQTKSEPASDALCWEDTIDNQAIISIYEYKTYHIWTKDDNNVITYYNKYNTDNEE